MRNKYWLITGLDEGVEITPYILDDTDEAISHCDTGCSDAARYREGFTSKEEANTALYKYNRENFKEEYVGIYENEAGVHYVIKLGDTFYGGTVSNTGFYRTTDGFETLEELSEELDNNV